MRLRAAFAARAFDDQTDAPIEFLTLRVGDPEIHCRHDPRGSFADGLCNSEERLQAAAWCLGAGSVEQDGDIIFAEVGGVDGTKGLFQPIGTPEVASPEPELPQSDSLLIAEVCRVL